MTRESSPIDQADVEGFFSLVEKNIGVSLDLSKAYLIHSRLSNVITEHQFSGPAPLLRFLITSPVGDIHWQAFEAMTTNETSFFRDIYPFEILKTTIIPALIEKRKDSRELNIWSAASSTGQEPYSIAILLREYFPELAGWKIRILATDISEQALEKPAQESITKLKFSAVCLRIKFRGISKNYLMDIMKLMLICVVWCNSNL